MVLLDLSLDHALDEQVRRSWADAARAGTIMYCHTGAAMDTCAQHNIHTCDVACEQYIEDAITSSRPVTARLGQLKPYTVVSSTSMCCEAYGPSCIRSTRR